MLPNDSVVLSRNVTSRRRCFNRVRHYLEQIKSPTNLYLAGRRKAESQLTHPPSLRGIATSFPLHVALSPPPIAARLLILLLPHLPVFRNIFLLPHRVVMLYPILLLPLLYRVLLLLRILPVPRSIFNILPLQPLVLIMPLIGLPLPLRALQMPCIVSPLPRRLLIPLTILNPLRLRLLPTALLGNNCVEHPPHQHRAAKFDRDKWG